MQTAEDAKKTAEAFLTKDAGQLKTFMEQFITPAASVGKSSATMPDTPSDFTKGRLEELGYSVSGTTVSW